MMRFKMLFLQYPFQETDVFVMQILANLIELINF